MKIKDDVKLLILEESDLQKSSSLTENIKIHHFNYEAKLAFRKAEIVIFRNKLLKSRY